MVFGAEDALINNVASHPWRSPVFPVFGPGECQLQPIYVEDVADIAVQVGHENDNRAVEAFGPETYTFEGLVRLIAEKFQSHAKMIHVPPGLPLLFARARGYAGGDILFTSDELTALMSDFLVSQAPPTGQTPLSELLDHHYRLPHP